ncbi:MAG: DEAD/DEAH box helicase family protein [Actinomycetota bacterium]
MNVTLKEEFQEGRVEELYKEARLARNEVAAEGKPQVLILASPTGSGKTVMVTALMELIAEGDDEHEGDEEAVFLWLSDDPELNEQSRRKIKSDSSVFDADELEVVEADSFDQRLFDPGKVYFLNIQKLGKKSNLLKGGDGRDHTIWATIESTIQESPTHFWLIIDEAHKGMRTAQQEKEAATIVQKFVKGSSEISPVPLVIGISATPERFEKVLEKAGRTKRVVEVTPAEVRSSGLLKERLTVYHPDKQQPADVSFLRSAATALDEYRKRWHEYVEKEGDIERFEPILIVQVADAGAKDEYSKTDLEEVLDQLDDVLGPLGEYEIAHAFQEHHPIDVGGRAVRYVPPPDIQEDAELRVVLFKQSLNTGWDCPRAEVVMSFRSASDYTNIAQLIGRLVRTPLARDVQGDDFLNSVALYLPSYDTDALERVQKYLTSKETGLAAPPDIERGENLVEYPRAKDKDDLFEKAEALPTYQIQRLSKKTNVQRLIKLCWHLTNDKIEPDSLAKGRKFVLAFLEDARKKRAPTKAFKHAVKNTTQIGMRGVTFRTPVAGEEDVDNETLEESFNQVVAAAENVDDVYRACGRRLGEGLHKQWLKARVAAGATPTDAKAELYALLADGALWDELQAAAGKRVFEKKQEHKTAISNLTESRRQEYDKLNLTGATGSPLELILPPTMIIGKDSETYERHLYADEDDVFSCKLNDWEQSTVDAELDRDDILGWVRNQPRKSWSLLVPYEWEGNDEPMYPDFLFFRQDGDHVVVDILDPHWGTHEDSAAKARGLAKFAEKHGHDFGRIEVIVKEGTGPKGKLRRLDVNRDEVRTEVVTLDEQDNAELRKLFDRYARS